MRQGVSRRQGDLDSRSSVILEQVIGEQRSTDAWGKKRPGEMELRGRRGMGRQGRSRAM